MSARSVEMYVVAHKEVDLSSLSLDNCYRMIRVGKYAKETGKTTIADCTGDNISYKNPNYCELTAHYWMWKNSSADVVGLCHYRRFFSADKKCVISEEEICSILQEYDVILPYRPLARRNVKNIYLDFGFEKDLDILATVLQEKYPECLAEYQALMKRHSNYPANMLICKKALFDEYSQWLFNILFEVERRCDLTGYTVQQARIFGFMSERLLEVWVRCKKLKVKNCHLLLTEEKTTLKGKVNNIVSIVASPFDI